MTSNVKAIPCKVDAISLTWSPQELLRIKNMAKIGASLNTAYVTDFKQIQLNKRLDEIEAQKNKELKSSPLFDIEAYQTILNRYENTTQRITQEYNARKHNKLNVHSLRLYENEVAARYELSKMLDGILEVDTSQKYDDRLTNLLKNIGVDLVDTLCCGEAERFVCMLNNVFSKDTYRWTVKPNATGRFNYQYSASLYVDDIHAGLIAWGGKNLGCYVSFMGTGCDALDFNRLYTNIKNIPSIKITRIDLAHDDFEGTRSIAVARKYAKKGGFNSGGRPAAYTYIESGHLNQKIKKSLEKEFRFIPDKGRTLYVGSRDSGKLLRVYEKGIQMGDARNKWVRWELELHSHQRVIPLETMIKPSEYLAGAYPALSFLNAEQSVIKTTVKKIEMSIEKIIQNQVTSTRKAINMMRVLCDMSDKEIVDKFLKGITEPFSRAALPQRLKFTLTEQAHLEQLQGA